MRILFILEVFSHFPYYYGHSQSLFELMMMLDKKNHGIVKWKYVVVDQVHKNPVRYLRCFTLNQEPVREQARRSTLEMFAEVGDLTQVRLTE